MWNHTGYVMVIMIAVIIVMKIRYIAHNVHVRKIVLDVQIIGVFQLRGIVMEMMIVVMVLMNLQSIVDQKVGHALVICLHVIMEIVCQGFIFVMGIMIVWIIVMKIVDINAVSKSLGSPSDLWRTRRALTSNWEFFVDAV